MTRLLLIYVGLCLPLCLWAEDELGDLCRDTVHLDALWHGYAALPKAPPPYLHRSGVDPRFYVKAEVDFTGALSFVFHTKITAPDGTELRSELRADEEFARILKHFEGSYNRLRIVYAEPEPEDSYPLGDMIAAVNRQTSAGVDLRSSLGFFFARQAYRHGFTSCILTQMGQTATTNWWYSNLSVRMSVGFGGYQVGAKEKSKKIRVSR
ncbi:MAG: hypothetical protein R3B54_04410 [Bdellovibrionota bacterium]